MIAPIPRDDRGRAGDAARWSDACCPNHRSTTWPDLVQGLRLARLAHDPDPQVAAVATAGIVIARALDRLAKRMEPQSWANGAK